MALFDSHKDFGYSTIRTGGAPSPATGGNSLKVQVGDGANFPTPPFRATVWPPGVFPIVTNAEIVQVNGTSGDSDTFVIARGQEGTTPVPIQAGYQIAATITTKPFTDVESAVSQKTVITIGTTAGADYVCNGLSDDVVFQAAFDAMATTGARIFIRSGTYHFNKRLTIRGKSDYVIEGESRGSVILQANQSLYVSGNDHHFGLLSIASHTGPIKNIQIKNLTIDANNQFNTECMTITGGNTEGVASTTNVLLREVTFKNAGRDVNDASRACLEIISGNMQFGNFGDFDQLKIYDCEFDTSQYYHIYLLGNFITNLKIKDCYFHDNQSKTINMFQYSTPQTGTSQTSRPRSNANWLIIHNRFQNTKLRVVGSTVADINDDNRTGVRNLKILDNYFGPKVTTNTDEISINFHQTWRLEIKGNYFDQVGEAISLGQSNAANYYKIASDMFVLIKDNIFFKVQKDCFDNDSNLFTKVIDNQFFYINSNCLSGYSRHWPTIYEGNYFYNSSSNLYDPSEYHKSAIEIVGDGYIVRHNTFIDDRLLSNPTVAPTLSTTSGGSQIIRTYYVQYTYVNDTGETLVSPEATITVGNNKLVTVALPSTAYPSGTKSINIYIGLASGYETLQGSFNLDTQTDTGSISWSTLTWTEPTTGLIAGAAPPPTNTTHAMMLYGIYELPGGGGPKLANYYYENHFYGVIQPIHTDTSYTNVKFNNYSNFSLVSGGEINLEGGTSTSTSTSSTSTSSTSTSSTSSSSSTSSTSSSISTSSTSTSVSSTSTSHSTSSTSSSSSTSSTSTSTTILAFG